MRLVPFSGVLTCDPFNFVPFTRTPWAGTRIAPLKRQSFAPQPMPDRIGESWEVSTDSQFPSRVSFVQDNVVHQADLRALIAQHGAFILGAHSAQQYGDHLPLLLKWIEASQTLSVQLHPPHGHPLLGPGDCGKPEAWLVLEVGPQGFLYLGFQEGLSDQQITACMRENRFTDCLQKIVPRPYDFISIPPGCVHALGPDVLVVEPQYVLPHKNGVTWRLFDWDRLYNQAGQPDVDGKPRPLHKDLGLQALDRTLPKGAALHTQLIHNVQQTPFLGDRYSPFGVQVFLGGAQATYRPLIPDQYAIFTVWGGPVTLTTPDGQSTVCLAGQSGILPAYYTRVSIEGPGACAFFSLAAAEVG